VVRNYSSWNILFVLQFVDSEWN